MFQSETCFFSTPSSLAPKKFLSHPCLIHSDHMPKPVQLIEVGAVRVRTVQIKPAHDGLSVQRVTVILAALIKC